MVLRIGRPNVWEVGETSDIRLIITDSSRNMSSRNYGTVSALKFLDVQIV